MLIIPARSNNFPRRFGTFLANAELLAKVVANSRATF